MAAQQAFARRGFIGLGSQGGPMALRLVRVARPVTVWARRQEVLLKYALAGADVSASPTALGASCDFVGVCVVDEAGVRAVVDGPEGILATMAPGGVIAVHSTIAPAACRDLAQTAAAHGVSLIDAPVSGGGRAASEGRLTVMVGGGHEVVARCRPIFEAFANTIIHLGPVGAGQTAKVINNTVMAANLALIHAATSLAGDLGVDPQALLTAMSKSSGGSFALETVRRRGRAGLADFGHGAALLRKDADILERMATAGADRTLLAVAAKFQTYFEQISQMQHVTPEKASNHATDQ